MNKNTKKFVVTLLSVLMVLSFMPTIAFAAPAGPGEPAGPAGGKAFGGQHEFVVDEDLSIDPTCSTPGVIVKTCLGQDLDEDSNAIYFNGKKYETEGPNKGKMTKKYEKYLENDVADHIDCDATQVSLVSPDATAHDYQKVYLSKEDYLNKLLDDANAAMMAAEGRMLTEAETKAIVDQVASYCTIYADQCTICGDIKNVVPQVHTPETDTPECAATYKCKYCGQTITRDNPAPHPADAYDLVERIENVCGIYTIEVRKCKKCGEEYKVNTNPDAATAQNQPVHTGFGPEQNPTDAEKTARKFVEYKGKYYEYNSVTTKPTCEGTGVGTLICTSCLRADLHQLTTAVIPALGHDYKKVTIPANHFHGEINYEYCTVCGKLGEYSTKNNKIAHSYTVTVVKDPDCYEDGITLVTCECGKFTTNRQAELDSYRPWDKPWLAGELGYLPTVVNSKEDGSGDWYFVGFDREFLRTNPDGTQSTIDTSKAIKLDSWKQLTEDLGAYETLQEATCTLPELQAQKCKTCGDLNVHTLRPLGKALGHDVVTETYEPTCGDCGHTVVSCARCKEELDITDFGEPVKYYGAECSFEWKVTKAPTATEDGEKALVCTVCGAVKDGSQTVIPRDSDEAKDAAIEAATPVIEAAAEKISNRAKYTDASMKAIDEARTMLNQAIAAGSAADVTRAAEALQKAVNAAAEKKANPMVAKAKTVKAKASKKTTIKAKKAFTVKKAQGKVTYKKKSGNGKITVSKAGKVTVKKGLKAGKTYKVKVQIKAAGNGNYLAKTKTVTLKVKVK